MQEDNEAPSSTSLFFSKRAKFLPTKSAEELKAASELLDKIQEEKSKTTKVPKVKASYVKSSDVEEAKVEESFPVRKTKPRWAKKVPPKITDLVDDIINDNDCNMSLSPAARKRLRAQQIERELELKRMEEENDRVLSKVSSSKFNEETIETPEYNFDKVQVLTVSYLSEVTRLKCYENETFSTVFPRVAELLKMNVTDFLLCFKEKNISVHDTPKSLNLSDSDVLDCIPYKSDGKSEIEVEYDQDKFKIAFQSNDNDEKVDLLVHKVEKMQMIMERYAEIRNLPLNRLTFEFDGEMLLGTETPEELDMESGNCVDVKVSAETSNVINIESRSGVDEIVLDSDRESENDIQLLDSNSGSGSNGSATVILNPINTAFGNIGTNGFFNPLNTAFGNIGNSVLNTVTSLLGLGTSPRRGRTPARGRGNRARGRGTPARGRGMPAIAPGTSTTVRGNTTRGRGTSVRGRGTPAIAPGTSTTGRGNTTRGRGATARGRGTPTKKRGTPTKRRGRSRGKK